jgi:fatty-acyl-CoA synthase
MGESVLAVVQPAEGAEPGDGLAGRLAAHAREHIAGYKIPRRFEFVAELPRTPVGKLNKPRLRAEYRY